MYVPHAKIGTQKGGAEPSTAGAGVACSLRQHRTAAPRTPARLLRSNHQYQRKSCTKIHARVGGTIHTSYNSSPSHGGCSQKQSHSRQNNPPHFAATTTSDAGLCVSTQKTLFSSATPSDAGLIRGTQKTLFIQLKCPYRGGWYLHTGIPSHFFICVKCHHTRPEDPPHPLRRTPASGMSRRRRRLQNHHPSRSPDSKPFRPSRARISAAGGA